MVKVTNIPPPPPDIYTRRVSVEMSEAEWLILKHAVNLYTARTDELADAINRAKFNSDGFYSLDYTRCFVDSRVSLSLNDSEKALIRSGSKIDAIKSLRDRSYLGSYLSLKEAKDICDAYAATL